VENHQDLTVWRPYDPTASVKLLENARQQLKDCFWTSNEKCRVNDVPENQRQSGLQPDNGMTLQKFKCDLWRLAWFGSELYSLAFSQMKTSNLVGLMSDFDRILATRTIIQVARTEMAQYVFPWAMIYDIPLPHKRIDGKLRWCDVLKEWSNPEGKRSGLPQESCPYQHLEEHRKNTLCPYGFWGLKHYIEQPVNVQPTQSDDKSSNSNGLYATALSNLSVGAIIDFGVGVTRDGSLNTMIRQHLSKINSISNYTPIDGADDLDKVYRMLESPEIVYFLCHGEYDVARSQPYLGVGPRDTNPVHRVYPDDLNQWVRTKGTEFWSGRHPIVFINGCHTGKLGPGEILNFVSTFAGFGASAIIGTEISVQLRLASEVAENLLGKIIKGTSLGQATYDIRWDLANKGNLLGLSYTPYGLAELHISRN